MKKTVIALMLALVAGSASAQNLNLDRSGPYVGANIGTVKDSDGRSLLGAVAGYQVNPYLRLEGAYDYTNLNGKNGQTLVVNAVPQYRIPGTVVTPYVLAGAGYAWDGLGKTNSDAATVYNLGVGVRVGLSAAWEFDARYRYLNKFDNDFTDRETQTVSAGLTYRF